jgi:hypothetical protein
MPEVNVTLSNMTMPGQEFLMDINYDTTYAWSTNCTQSLKGVAKSCDLEPSKVILTSNYGDATTNTYVETGTKVAGGYQFSGMETTQSVDMMINDKQKVGFTDQVQVVDQILNDAWLYQNLNQVNNGAWAFGYNSKFTQFYTFKDQTVLSY